MHALWKTHVNRRLKIYISSESIVAQCSSEHSYDCKTLSSKDCIKFTSTSLYLIIRPTKIAATKPNLCSISLVSVIAATKPKGFMVVGCRCNVHITTTVDDIWLQLV